MKVKLTNPALDKKGSARVMRGGGFSSSPFGLRASLRDDFSPSSRRSYGGFRLVKTK